MALVIERTCENTFLSWIDWRKIHRKAFIFCGQQHVLKNCDQKRPYSWHIMVTICYTDQLTLIYMCSHFCVFDLAWYFSAWVMPPQLWFESSQKVKRMVIVLIWVLSLFIGLSTSPTGVTLNSSDCQIIQKRTVSALKPQSKRGSVLIILPNLH